MTAETQTPDLLPDAAAFVQATGKCSGSSLQSRFSIGWNKASALIERLEDAGAVGPADHVGSREIFPDALARLTGEKPETTMTLTTPDGQTTAPFTAGDLEAVAMKINGRPPMKETDADRAVGDNAYRVTRAELQSFVERFERLEAERKELADQQKEVMAEAKARGYDTRCLRQVIKLRAKDPQELAEAEAVLQLYREALGV
ncbi:hypothetical protein DDZ14_08360 [Maritimibacter sp. 55A14]|uniref:GapR family DNA-binding domain-containing protein n=1 Tax=Maritimibacter sp. 55A14 TaxID=2174844 RepID=UPI000D60B893|nr:GapR family DNA-binding domain-containing protein [Maritimibacter sp. 55A14]PWE32749.1 hypothetical protein DDZ14_08360 [Maritimibacter sp. 55A14]